MSDKKDSTPSVTFGGVMGVFFAIIFTIAVPMWGCPQYSVYSKRLEGEGDLAKANFTREVKVREAQAALDAAKLLNQAEVVRAEGLAQAAAKVINVLGGPEAYLRYLWIQNLEHGSGEKIYIPTEAGMPILEAGKNSVVRKPQP